MSRAVTPGGIIHDVAASAPEKALLAAVIQLAVEDAQKGDVEALEWLHGPTCRSWLHLITPDDVDAEAVRARLLAMLPKRAPPAGAAREAASVVGRDNGRGPT